MQSLKIKDENGAILAWLHIQDGEVRVRELNGVTVQGEQLAEETHVWCIGCDCHHAPGQHIYPDDVFKERQARTTWPLTVEQKACIRETAYNVMYEDAMQNWDFLKSVIRGYLDTMTLEQQAETISSDEAVMIEILGFDPKTGKEVDDDPEED
jgi:hypothetical protein